MAEENKSSVLRVTFDTNVCDIIHDSEKKAAILPPEEARKLRQALRDGTIAGFVSEGTLFVECLSFEDKLAYLSVVGTKNERPTPVPRRTAVFQDLAKLGLQYLAAPLIAGERFDSHLPRAADVHFTPSDRHERFSSFLRAHWDLEPLKMIGRSFLPHQPPLPGVRTTWDGNVLRMEQANDWTIGLKREWDSRDQAGKKALRNQVGPLIGEWCDTLIVASHVAYGNDVFCTADEGKGAGSGSLLHHSNRTSLLADGVRIVAPSELLASLQ